MKASLSFLPLPPSTKAVRLLPNGLTQPHSSSTVGLERSLFSTLEFEREARHGSVRHVESGTGWKTNIDNVRLY
jgi:hypothetical protein